MSDTSTPATAPAPETLQEQVEEHEETRRKKFGTFGGVFTPTLLTILGVIMYLRLGWVMGNAGLVGGLLIIFGAFAITTFTALSMSSITTNIRIGAGGAYAIVSQSLGLEIGGAVGIPRYISQALAVTMYIFGFREGWLWVFPDHHALLVDLVAFVLLWAIAYKSADLAIRVQFLIMVVIIGSLVSIAIAAAQGSMTEPLTSAGLWGEFPGSPEDGFQGATFWMVFAVFFPASTGIMAGANMSGDLKDPRHSIPLGTMAAIGVSLAVYVALAVWIVRSAGPEELVSNYTVMIDKAFWGPAVLAGLLGATLSSALASIVGSARILQAMGEHKVVPAAGWLGRLDKTGEPRNSMLVTGGIILATLMLRDLNAVAPLITMFFLLTYAMLNAVMLIEQHLDLVSFRPLLRLPKWVPLLGLAGSLVAMFVIHPVFSLIAVAITLFFYYLLAHRRLPAPFGDVRSGLFVSLAEWAAQRVSEMPAATERAWKPNLLVPVEDPTELRGTFHFLRNLTYPQGTIKLLGLASGGELDRLRGRLPRLDRAFRNEGIFSDWTLVETADFGDGLLAGVQTLRGTVFRPNILFLPVPTTPDPEREEDLGMIIRRTADHGLGILLFCEHPKARLGRRQVINVWVRDQSPDWELSMELGDLDLSLLTGHKLRENWNGSLRIITCVRDEASVEEAEEYLASLVDLARMPGVRVHVHHGDFATFAERAPVADLNLFGLPGEVDFRFVRRLVETTHSTCVFVRDSGEENVLA